MKVLIFANGKAKNGAMVEHALADSQGAMLIAADGGARVAWHYGKQPQVVIGDMDSLSSEEIAKLEARGATILRYPPEKDETDLELALTYAAEHGASWIRILGAIGGRFDQMLANVYLLGLPQLADCDVALVANKQQIQLLTPGDHLIVGDIGDTISLIPISGDVSGITTHYLKYPLKDEKLNFGPARGISNVMTGQQAEISIRDGKLLCVHTKGRA